MKTKVTDINVMNSRVPISRMLTGAMGTERDKIMQWEAKETLVRHRKTHRI